MWRKAQELATCEVLIIGGGVNGAAIFRDLSAQGVQCVLVEREDFSSGASSKSSRMIHGGLRYLEYAEFRLVREAVQERNWLLKQVSHYVHPLRTTIPIYKRWSGLIAGPLRFIGLNPGKAERGALIVKMGLLFYDLLASGSRVMPWHTFQSRKKALGESPQLNPEIVCTATYWDAWISHPERLCVELIADGCKLNNESVAINYATATKESDAAFELHDSVSGTTTKITPKVVVNAAGPWIDKVNAGLGIDDHLVSGTKGTHLVIDNAELFKAIGERMFFYETADGRICLVFQFMDKVITGTTDSAIDDPDEVSADEAEVAYILDSLKRVFPKIVIKQEEIVHTYCGVRPLQASKAASTGSISRDHICQCHDASDGRAFPVFSLVGGKLTSFRAFAEQSADMVLAYLKKKRVSSTRNLPLPLLAVGKEGLEGNQVDDNTIERAVAEEWVMHLADFARRRTLLKLLGGATPEKLVTLADKLGSLLGWSSEERAAEIRAAQACD